MPIQPQSLSNLQKIKLFNEAQALVKNLSPEQIDQALASNQFANDEFIFTLIQQAQKERDSLPGKIKRWYKRHEADIKLTAKLNGIIYGLVIGLSIISYGILFAIGTVFVISPLSPLGIAMILGFPLIGMVANQLIGRSLTWALNKIIDFFRKKTPSQIETEEKAEKLKQQLKETNTPSFEVQPEPANAAMARVGLHAANIAAKMKNDYHHNPACSAFLDAMSNESVTSYSFESSYYHRLDNNDAKALIDILPFTKISSLRFSQVDQADVVKLAKQKQIKEIAISSPINNNLALDDASLQEIAKQSHIKSFSYQTFNPTKETYKAFLLTNTTLNELTFNLPALQNNGNVSAEDIFSYLKQNKNLTTIQMRNFPHSGIFQPMIDDLFKSNFQLQKVSLTAHWGGRLPTNALDPLMERNKQLADVRNQAQTLLADLKLNRTHLNSDQMTRIVQDVADTLTERTNTLLQDIDSREAEAYKNEMLELANELQLWTANWIESSTGRPLANKSPDSYRIGNLQLAYGRLFSISPNSKHFAQVRIRAFEHQYYGNISNQNDQNKLSRFFYSLSKILPDNTVSVELPNPDDQEIIDLALLDSVGIQYMPINQLLSQQERLALLQYGLMKQADTSLLAGNDSISLPIQAKPERFKLAFDQSPIKPDDYQALPCQQQIQRLWGTFLEAQGAIQDRDIKKCIDHLCDYEKSISLPSVNMMSL